MVYHRETIVYQCSRTEGCVSGNKISPKKPTRKDCVPKHGQLYSGCLNQPHGRHKLPGTPRSDPGTLELVYSKRPVHYSTPRTGEDKPLSRPGIQAVPGQQPLDDKPDNYSAFFEELSNRPLHFPANTATTSLHQLEAGSRCYPLRCIHHELGGSCRICIPTVQPCFQGPEQSNVGQNRDRSSSSYMASPAVVAPPSKVTGEINSPPSE